MDKIKPDHGPQSPSEEAARWFLRLQEESDQAETFLEWQRWLSASSAHRSAYEEIEETVLRLSRSAAKPPLPSADELARDTYDGSQSIAQWQQGILAPAARPPEAASAQWRQYSVAAGLFAVSVASVWLWMQNGREEQLGTFAYHTAPGQRQVVTLPEGSKVTLDADSQLDVQLRSNARSLTLKRGEAFFEVAKDKRRPFVVRAGTAQVIAVGTAFNVRMGENRTVVAVTEGKVEVVTAPKAITAPANIPAARQATAPRLTAQVSAGEAVSYVDDGNLQALAAAEAQLATAWLEGRRQYRNEPLRYVLADVDRYTGHHIELAGEAADLRFTGTLDLENSEAWLRGLSVALPVQVTQHADGTLSVTMQTGL